MEMKQTQPPTCRLAKREWTMRLLAFLLTATGAATCASRADASIVTGSITGTVTSANAVRGVTVGSSVSGSYAYDDAVTMSGAAGQINPLTGFSLTIGVNPFVFGLGDLIDSDFLRAGRLPAKSTPGLDSLFFFFDFSAATAFLGDSAANQRIQAGFTNSYEINGTNPAINLRFDFAAIPNAVAAPSAVPEPSTLVLVAMSGIILTGCNASLRRRNRPEKTR